MDDKASVNDPKHGFENEPLLNFFKELAKVKNSQRSLALVTNGVLELFVETLIKASCRNHKRITEDNRSFPYSVKLLMLNEVGVLDDEYYKHLDWFRKIRNEAAHKPIFEVTDKSLKGHVSVEYSDPEKLHDLCSTMISAFWNDYIDVLSPVFAPKIHQARARAASS